MYKFLSSIVLLCVLSFCSNPVFGQKGYYSNTTEFIAEENPFGVDANQHIYEIDGVEVREYYTANNKKFIGYYIDAKKVDLKKLHVVMYNDQVKKLARKGSVKEALSFVFDNISPGMTVEEVVAILGKPERFKYAISGSNQLLYYYYEKGLYQKLVFKDDLLVGLD